MTHSLKGSILRVLAFSHRVDKRTFLLLHESPTYVRKCLRELTEEKIVKESKSAGFKSYALTLRGETFLREQDQKMFSFYKNYFGNPGRTQRHKDIYRRLGYVTAMLEVAGCSIGTDKPSLAETKISGVTLSRKVNTFYSLRELREDQQRESRTNMSRASGVIFSDAGSAITYACCGDTMVMNRMCELETLELLKQSMYSVYAHVEEIQRAILLVPDDSNMMRLIESTEKNNYIGNLLPCKGKKGIRIPFYYIPMMRFGCVTLKRLLNFSNDQFKRMCFTADEMKAAQEQGVGDAIIKGLICYEFVSSNISSLIRIREQHAENMSGVGIVCDVEQVPFVRLFFTNFPEIKIHALSTNKINQFIFGREDVL